MADKCRGQTYWDVAYQVKLRRKKSKCLFLQKNINWCRLFTNFKDSKDPGKSNRRGLYLTAFARMNEWLVKESFSEFTLTFSTTAAHLTCCGGGSLPRLVRRLRMLLSDICRRADTGGILDSMLGSRVTSAFMSLRSSSSWFSTVRARHTHANNTH